MAGVERLSSIPTSAHLSEVCPDFRLALCNRMADVAPIGRIQALESLKIEAREWRASPS